MCLNHLSNEQTGYYWRHQHTQEHTHTLLSFTDRVSDFLDVNSADVNTHTHIHAHTHTHSAIVCWESSWFSGCQQCWCKHTHTHTHTHWYHFLTEFLIFWMLAAPNQTHPPHTHARTHTHTHTHTAIVCWQSSWFSGCRQHWCTAPHPCRCQPVHQRTPPPPSPSSSVGTCRQTEPGLRNVSPPSESLETTWAEIRQVRLTAHSPVQEDSGHHTWNDLSSLQRLSLLLCSELPSLLWRLSLLVVNCKVYEDSVYLWWTVQSMETLSTCHELSRPWRRSLLVVNYSVYGDSLYLWWIVQ